MADFEKDYWRPPVKRPVKDINVFISDENIGVFAPGIFEGEMGPLPLLISVNVGYYPEQRDPYMYHFESQEIMFAYKKDAQKRVFIIDSRGHTLSLPVNSSLPFHLGSDSKEMTMAEIVSSNALPVSCIQFARTGSLDIIVDGHAADHSFFGFMTVTEVYDEEFMWCLAVHPSGTTGDKPFVLPRNLLSTGFCPVVGIHGVKNQAAKVKEFIDKFSKAANQIHFEGDPFYQEMAFISRGPKPVEKIEAYMDETTFIPIRVGPKPPPLPPLGEPPPPPPPRTHLRQRSKEELLQYSSVSQRDAEEDDEHIYSPIVENQDDDQLRINLVKPLQKLHMAHTPDKGSLGRLLMRPPDAARILPPVPEQQPFPERRKTSFDSGDSVEFRNVSGVSLMSSRLSELSSPTLKAHLNTLSVEDVALKLKELGLGKYAKKFRKNRIDGVLLSKLAEQDLKNEFGMTHTEFLLLHTFVTEGHIPQMRSAKK
ncbi:hypothetical protein ACOMHN_047224 [Nucella lapillus]